MSLKKVAQASSAQKNDEENQITSQLQRLKLEIFEPVWGEVENEYFYGLITQYESTFIDLVKRGPILTTWLRVDFSVNYILRPAFFNEDLTTRVNNNMLVSALLLTISAANFVNPATADNTNSINRVYIYVLLLSIICFVVSIFLGVKFVEDGLSRSYTERDRFIMVQHGYKNFLGSMTFMLLGSLLLLFSFVLFAAINYLHTDAVAFGIITIISVAITTIIILLLSIRTSKLQFVHTNMFIHNLLEKDGHMKAEFLAEAKQYQRSSKPNN